MLSDAQRGRAANMPRAASCLAHGGSSDAGQPCLTAASGQVAVRLWQGGAQQGGDARRRTALRHDSRSSPRANRGSLVCGRKQLQLQALLPTNCEAAAKLATCDPWCLAGAPPAKRRQSTRRRFIRVRTGHRMCLAYYSCSRGHCCQLAWCGHEPCRRVESCVTPGRRPAR